EIAPADLTGADLREVGAPARGRRAHPDVRRLADVPVAGPSRVDLEAVGEPGLLDLPAEDALSEGAPADVAEANEQHPDGPRGDAGGVRRGLGGRRLGVGGALGRHARRVRRGEVQGEKWMLQTPLR